MIFGEYSDIVENYILTMQRFLDISRFLYSWGWQVCTYVILLVKLSEYLLCTQLHTDYIVLHIIKSINYCSPIFIINNDNRIEWSPIRCVIIRVINKIR